MKSIVRLSIMVLLLFAISAVAQSFIVPPDSLPYGKSYEQWSAKWWQWVEAIPYSMNPMFDTTGAFCAVDQRGPVWFLAGTAGFDAMRACTIPPGKMIFFPIINWNNDYPCPAPNFEPGPGQSLEQFLTVGYGPNLGVRQQVDHVTAVSASLDGEQVQNLVLPPETSPYRNTSPLFNFNADRSMAVTDPCLPRAHKGVSDGYWIMLKPLAPGQHTLMFSGTSTWPGNPPWTVSVTFYLTVE